MRRLFDFGISQEDPCTEFNLLDIQPADHLLSIASAGEIPLSLLCLQPGVKITAVDISPSQLILCRLKMKTALTLPFPDNGAFLGYARAGKKWRREIYYDQIESTLPGEDRDFWKRHFTAIEKGVVNFGRFESYINNLRWILYLIIGKKNIEKLLAGPGIAEQEMVFDKFISGRKAVKYLFRLAFHPAIYKKRGLAAQGLIHAKSKAGEVFFNKFRSFCTATPSDRNYFLHYFLTGNCPAGEALPEYLQESNRPALARNQDNIRWKLNSLQDELKKNPRGTFNKIHLSNIGDWMSEEEFIDFLDILLEKSTGKETLCYRFLQKNHLPPGSLYDKRFGVTPVTVEKTDRFPFYSVLSIRGHG